MHGTDEQNRKTEMRIAAQRLAAVGGWEYDHRTETLYCTDEFTRICGCEPDDDTLSALIDQFHPADQPAVRAAIDDAITAGDHVEGEWRLRPQDGEQRWVRLYGEPDRAAGAVVRIRGAIEEITAETQHKKRLRRLFETTRELLGQESPEAVATVAVEAARDVLGLSITGVHLHDPTTDRLEPTAATTAAVDTIGEPPAFGEGESIAWEVFETGEAQIYDDVRTAPNRHTPDTDVRSEFALPLGEHGVFLAGSPQADAFGEHTVSLAKLLATVVEVALDQLADGQRLRRQNDRLAEFASIVSHDLRNPLSVARAGVKVAKTEAGDGDSLERVDRAHDRMDVLIDDLLSLAHSGQDIEAADMEPVSVAAIASRAWQSVETGKASLDIDADDRLVADSSRLQQLCENLFRNSIAHGSPGDQADGDNDRTPITVRVGTCPDGFCVEDDGVGIPPADRETVFEPGYTTHDDGTGLGLRIVATIADAHGWDVSLTAAETGGARFEFTGVDR